MYAAVTNSGLPLACCRYDTFTDTVPADAPAPCNSKILRSPAHLDALLHDHAVDYGLWNKLYSATLLTPAMLETFDVLVYDIQDVGSRYYTFLSTLAYLIEDCAGAGKRLVVLDRPDPLGGEIIEGTTLRPGMENFVGCYPLPTRYALTIGEFAKMVNAEQHFGCDLTVVPCTGWQRGQSAPAWGTPWIMPSPNIPNYETALLYVGTCLFEGTNVSEGRGTVRRHRCALYP